MTKALALENGDLVLGPGGFATIEGERKVFQDLSLAILEPYGNDRFHPRWGSLLDRFVGSTLNDETDLLIRSEVTRIIRNYMAVQQDRYSRDIAAGLKPPISAGEMVSRIDNLTILHDYDRYHLTVRLMTLAGQPVTLTSTVGA